MLSRFGIVAAVCLLGVSSAAAQVVRFETTVGDFDMVLNPTNNPRLQGHVDNLLQYVEDNKYRGTWINRAHTDFVLQMGGFYSHTRRVPLTVESTRNIAPFAPVEGSPGISGLSNTVGTVAMALSGGIGGTNQDSGTSSFFVNLASNTFLDADFTVFAAIPDMTVINKIMDLSQVNLASDPDFGINDPGNLAFDHVPLDGEFQVFIKRAFVISDGMTITMDKAKVQSVMQQSAAAFEASLNGDSSGDLSLLGGAASSAPSSAAVVPEPAAAFLLLLGASSFVALRRRRSG